MKMQKAMVKRKRTQSAKCPLRRFTGNSSRSNSAGEAQIGKSDELKGNAIKQLQPSKDFNNAIKYPNIAAHGVAKLICSKNPWDKKLKKTRVDKLKFLRDKEDL